MYINDLAIEDSKSPIYFFADDATMIMTGTSAADIADDLNSDVVSAVNWCKRNKMTANILKTIVAFLLSAQKHSQLQDNAPNIRNSDDKIQLSNKQTIARGNSWHLTELVCTMEATLKQRNSLYE